MKHNAGKAGGLGYLLVGHGSRNTQGPEQLRALHTQFAQLVSPACSQFCFLELAEPDISSGIEQLALQGASEVVVVPALLFSAGHASRDIPREVAAACEKHSVSLVSQTGPLECCDAVVQLSALRFRQAVCSLPIEARTPGLTCEKANECQSTHCNQVGLVIVGRGSSSESATEQMLRFAQLRCEYTPVTWQQTAFIHGQQPDVPTALDELERQCLPLAVVQPHLLFEGVLSQQLRREVEERQHRNPGQHWVFSEPLGTDKSLAEAFVTIAKTRK